MSRAFDRHAMHSFEDELEAPELFAEVSEAFDWP